MSGPFTVSWRTGPEAQDRRQRKTENQAGDRERVWQWVLRKNHEGRWRTQQKTCAVASREKKASEACVSLLVQILLSFLLGDELIVCIVRLCF